MLTQVVAGRVFDYSHCIGEYLGGTQWGGEGFVQPIATATGSDDTVYVLGRGSESTDHAPTLQARAFGTRIGKFSIGSVPGDEEHLATFGSFGEDDGQFIWPAGMALDSQGNVYVTDEWLNRVTVFDKDGTLIARWGSGGDGDGEFNRPSGIAIDGDDNLFIVDSLNHRVQVFTRDGTFTRKWGSFGGDSGELDSPWGVAVDRQGDVYVVDHKNHRVQRFTSDGQLVRQYGSYGRGRGELNRPTDAAVDPEGDVYVCDWANNRVQVYDPEGEYVASMVGDAQELSKWGKATVDANPDVQKARRRVKSKEPEWRFALPTGVTFDPVKWRIIVADTQRYRLQIYNKLRDYVEPQFNL